MAPWPIEDVPPVARIWPEVRVSTEPGPESERPPPVTFIALIVRVGVFIATLDPICTVFVAVVTALRFAVS